MQWILCAEGMSNMVIKNRILLTVAQNAEITTFVLNEACKILEFGKTDETEREQTKD